MIDLGETVLDRYQDKIIDMYCKAHPNLDRAMVASKVIEFTNERMKNIPCQLHNNITHDRIDTTVLDTFVWIENRQPIITGNGTFFKQHEEYLAPTVKMLEKLQVNRKVKKKEMYQYPKGSVEYNNRNVGQLSIKVIMNADYGGSGTTLSPFYSCYIPPATTGSAKNITTSLICCLEFISGNNDQWAKLMNVNELYDMIFSVLNDTRTDREFIKDTFSVDEVLSWLVSRANNMAGRDKRCLRTFLTTLTNDELCKLMLAFNPRLVLNKYLWKEVSAISDYLCENCVDLNAFETTDFKNDEQVKQLKDEIHRCGYGVKAPEAIADTIEQVSKVIVDNCVYPFVPNDAEMRAANMDRIIVCVTDTDSLMVQFAHFIDDFFIKDQTKSFKEKCLIASAFGMRLFIEHVIPRMVEDIANFCNIKDEYYRKKFVFKNEFAFLAMALIAKKMYASSMFVQEGSPRDPHEIAVSGLSFKKRDAAEFLEPIMVNIYDKYVLTCDKVSLSGILDEYNTLRRTLVDSIGTDPSYYKVLSIKDAKAYDPTKVLPAQMRGAIVWNAIMPDEEILPLDRVIVIPLSFDLLEQHKDEDGKINEILRISLIDNEKRKNDPYICIPEHYHSIPEWISKVIDIDYAADKLLMPFRQLLDAFGVYVVDVRGGFRPSNLAYI